MLEIKKTFEFYLFSLQKKINENLKFRINLLFFNELFSIFYYEIEEVIKINI